MSVGERLGRLRAAMAEAELPALLVTQPDARRYLSGYTAPDIPVRESSGCLLITQDRQMLLTDARTEALAVQEAPDFEVRSRSGTTSFAAALKAELVGAGVSVLGFEADHMTFDLWQRLGDALKGTATLRAAPGFVDELRMIKDAEEIEALRASIALNDAAFAHLARNLHAGQTELDLAWSMEHFVRSHGGEGVSFPPITVGGPNSAIPHAVPSARPVQTDEMVLFDIGSRLGGYCSDMTRTVCIDRVPDRLRDIWHVVESAQLEAASRVQSGMTGTDVDRVARDVITEAGYGEYFRHGLGHGVGLEIHEPPWLTQSRGDMVLRPGMVFSIEPGIYLEGSGGVRLEDLYLLSESGVEKLSQSPNKLYLTEVLDDLDG